MKKILINGLLVSVCVMSMTSSAFAVWWNPMTWFKPKIVTIQKNIEVATTTQAIQVTSTNGVTNKEQKKNQVADTTNPLDNSTMPKGINVPPVPDEKINNSTLAGVDSNNNGVRDDIERYLAKNAKNNNEFQYFLRYVR